MADDRSGQGEGHKTLADSIRTREQVGVSKSAARQRPAENFFLSVMAENLVEGHADLLLARN